MPFCTQKGYHSLCDSLTDFTDKWVKAFPGTLEREILFDKTLLVGTNVSLRELNWEEFLALIMSSEEM